MAQAFTDQELKFFSRMADKMAAGMSMDDAGRAILAEDRASVEKVEKLNSYDRDSFVRRMSRNVYASIHMREALAA